MSITKHLTDLTDVLLQNVELYQAMSRELELERETYKTRSLVNIDALLKRKESLVFRLKSLEKARASIMEKLSQATGVPEAALTYDHLLEFASEPLEERLISVRQRLREVIARADELNSFNRDLVGRLIKINYEAAAHLKRLIEPDETYRLNGRREPVFRPGRVVRQTL